MCVLTNRILRVDLTHGKITKETMEENLLRDYIGGIGIGVRIVYDEVPPGVDALDPQSRLVFAVSPLTGTALPGDYGIMWSGNRPRRFLHYLYRTPPAGLRLS